MWIYIHFGFSADIFTRKEINRRDFLRGMMGYITYVFIDESGDLGKFGSKYFTVAAIIVDEPIRLRRIIKRIRQRKLKKKIKELPEIKANNSDRLIKEFVLRKIKETECKIFAVVVNKEKIFEYLFDKQNLLYNYLCGILFKILDIKSGKVIITIDKKHTNTLIKDNFDRYIKSKLGSRRDIKLEIYYKHSYTSNELQIVDFVAWSVNRKFNMNDDYYYKIIENKIINRDKIILWEK